MPFQIIRNDITKVKADAIVNTANPKVDVGSGVDYAIYKVAGMENLLAEREKIGELLPGEAGITKAFNLDAKFIIHVSGPHWENASKGEETILRKCYDKALNLAAENGCQSIAFPVLSTGTYGFPQKIGIQIAVDSFTAFLEDHEMEITLVVFGDESVKVSGEIVEEVSSYIDDSYVKMALASEEIPQSQKERMRIYGESSEDRKDMQAAEDEEVAQISEYMQAAEDEEVAQISEYMQAAEDEKVPRTSIEKKSQKKSRDFSARMFFSRLTGKKSDNASAILASSDIIEDESADSESPDTAPKPDFKSVVSTSPDTAPKPDSKSAEDSQEKIGSGLNAQAESSAQEMSSAQAMPGAKLSGFMGAAATSDKDSLEDLLKGIYKESFEKHLQKLINKKGLKNSEVYAAANISKQYFSKLLKGQVKPSKGKMLALAVGLRLNMDETVDFLKVAGYALSPISQTDAVVGYFIEHEDYNVLKIDIVLFDYGLDPLSSI